MDRPFDFEFQTPALGRFVPLDRLGGERLVVDAERGGDAVAEGLGAGDKIVVVAFAADGRESVNCDLKRSGSELETDRLRRERRDVTFVSGFAKRLCLCVSVWTPVRA